MTTASLLFVENGEDFLHCESSIPRRLIGFNDAEKTRWGDVSADRGTPQLSARRFRRTRVIAAKISTVGRSRYSPKLVGLRQVAC